MTPPAATAAARLATSRQSVSAAPSRSRRGTEPRAGLRRPPRRLSGPAAGIAREVTAVTHAVAPVAPRRAATADPEARRRTSAAEASLSLLGRTRLWTAVFIVGLAGVVFLQDQLRTLDSEAGGAAQAITHLQRDNAVLRSEISSLSSDDRIVSQAKRLGFVEPPVGSTRFLASSGDYSRRAVAMMAPSSGGTAYASLDVTQSPDPGQPGDGSAAVADAVGTDAGQGTATTDPGSQQSTMTTAAVPDGGTGPASG